MPVDPDYRALSTDEPVLTVDPRRQFGRVCIIGTRIPAESVAWAVWADGVEDAMEDYGVTHQQALLACWWLVENCRGVRRKTEREIVARWGEWADEALFHLGGHRRGQPCPEPPDAHHRASTEAAS